MCFRRGYDLNFYKSILLMVCAGLSVCGWVILSIGFSEKYSLDFFNYENIIELFSFFLFGSVFCLIFGVPFLLLIDKFFKKFWAKYIFGGGFFGWLSWFMIAGPLFSLDLLLKPSACNWRGSSLFFYIGLAAGVLFTVVLAVFSKIGVYDKLCKIFSD